MSPIQAVIIAGGRGERLGGVRKADLRIGGIRQLDRAIAALGDVALPILVSTGTTARSGPIPNNCEAVADLDSPVAGPLAGLVAAVARLTERGVVEGLLVSVAVDTPFLPPGFAMQMAKHLGQAKAGFATWGEDFYPPNAIWRLEALQHLPAAIRQDAAPSSLKNLQGDLAAVAIDWTKGRNTNPFASINTLGDLLTLQRRAAL